MAGRYRLYKVDAGSGLAVTGSGTEKRGHRYQREHWNC